MTLRQKLIDAGLGSLIVNVDEDTGGFEFSRDLTQGENFVLLKVLNPNQEVQFDELVELMNNPLWSSLTHQQWDIYWNANLSDDLVDSFSIPAPVKAMLKVQNNVLHKTGHALIAVRKVLVK